MRIGVECGGTFTDLVVLDDDGRLRATDKVFSTPDDPARAVSQALEGLDAGLVDGASLLHGSTVATNALIERKGARIGLIVTKGFRDLVFLQRQDRAKMYDLKFSKPAPLVERSRIAEVAERLEASGDVLLALDTKSVRAAVQGLVDDGVDAIAVSLLHSYANPEHELLIAELIASEFPRIVVSLSSECSREFREYERTTTTTIDAFLRPRISQYLAALGTDAQKRGILDLQVMQSNGGMVPARTAASNPLTMLRSGPAAGVAGAVAVTQLAGFNNIVTMDMGGTSTDVAVIRNGEPELTAESMADGLPLRVPMIDIIAVGAGGGSLVDIDSGGLLTVGPLSAGADPGPVCYGRGGLQPTVTDANVVRGLLRPETFLGGKHSLHGDAAAQSMQPYAEKLGVGVDELAEDIYRLASVHMASAIRMTTTERGHEVSEYTLCAYGGAGGLHAASVAEELGIGTVIIPPHSGLASAYGLLTAGFRREFARTHLVAASGFDDLGLHAICSELEDDARRTLAGEGIDLTDAVSTFAADMRYTGQGFEVVVDFPAGKRVSLSDVLDRFHGVHDRRYGYSDRSRPVQLVTIRLTITKSRPSLALPRVDIDTTLTSDTRPILEGGRLVEAVFRERRSMDIGSRQPGPAVLEDTTSTTFVPSGWVASVDDFTNLILERG